MSLNLTSLTLMSMKLSLILMIPTGFVHRNRLACTWYDDVFACDHVAPVDHASRIDLGARVDLDTSGDLGGRDCSLARWRVAICCVSTARQLII